MKQDPFRIIDGQAYYRVTTILKETINSEGLNHWLKTHGFKEAIKEVEGVGEEGFRGWRNKLTLTTFIDWLKWYKGATDRKRDNAADRGTAVHDHIFNFLSGSPVDLPETDPCYIPVNEFKKWAKDVNLDASKKILEYQLVYKPDCSLRADTCAHRYHTKCLNKDGDKCPHFECGFTGKLDYLPLLNNHPIIIDLKTSPDIYPNMLLQVAAYWGAWNEMNPTQPVGDCMICRVDKTDPIPPEILVLPAKVMPELFDIFLATKKLWSFLTITKGKKDRKEWLNR